MRFDYLPPSVPFRFFRWRRIVPHLLATTGVLCIVLALVTNSNTPPDNTSPVIQQVEQNINLFDKLKKEESIPMAISKQTSPSIKTTPSWVTIRVKPNDTLFSIFSKLGLSEKLLYNILAANPASKQLSMLYPGQVIQFLLNPNNKLQEIKLSLTSSKTLIVRQVNKKFQFLYNSKQLRKEIKYSQNSIKDSLFASAQAAGLNDRLIMQLANIFAWDIDFVLDIRQNDSFKVLYEEEYLDDDIVDTGKILVAEFVNRNKTYRAVRYDDKKGSVGYYSPEGMSLQKAFLRTPVKFTRISSHFSHGRHHPILHRIRAHRGVDYAAPRGTPVKAAGKGKVRFKGKKGGYGQAIELQHGPKYTTFYAHLSRYAKNIKVGKMVQQGEIIGYVGRTGLATGDHLHYEFRVNGVHHNPLTVKLPKALPIQNKDKQQFIQHANQMLDLLRQHSTSSQFAKNG